MSMCRADLKMCADQCCKYVCNCIDLSGGEAEVQLYKVQVPKYPSNVLRKGTSHLLVMYCNIMLMQLAQGHNLSPDLALIVLLQMIAASCSY